MRRLALVAVAALAFAGCGSSAHKSTTASTPPAQTQIRRAYEKFFAGQTPVSERVALLQNGPKFKPVIKAFASNPLAKSASAKVSSVRLEGANSAKVVFTVKVGGVALPKQTGTAVRENGVWKVGDSSLCDLVSLQGSTPSACNS